MLGLQASLDISSSSLSTGNLNRIPSSPGLLEAVAHALLPTNFRKVWVTEL